MYTPKVVSLDPKESKAFQRPLLSLFGGPAPGRAPAESGAAVGPPTCGPRVLVVI